MKREVRLKYHDKNGQVIREENMSLEEYTGWLKGGLQRMIGNVEQLIYSMNGNKPREEWDADTIKQFGMIRRQLLDIAGDVGRIPEVLNEKPTKEEQEKAFWGGIFRN